MQVDILDFDHANLDRFREMPPVPEPPAALSMGGISSPASGEEMFFETSWCRTRLPWRRKIHPWPPHAQELVWEKLGKELWTGDERTAGQAFLVRELQNP
jgi:hypothetical protein